MTATDKQAGQFDSVDWIPKATEAIDNLDTRLRAVERELARKGVQ